MASKIDAKAVPAVAEGTSVAAPAVVQIPKIVKLLIGAGGIYSAFLYYGTLQEDVFHYTAANGDKFKAAWFLQALEAFANVIVCAKAFTSLSLASGVSFPVVTLAKSGKMVPVMIGSLLLGGAKYTLREYASVLAIIIGTCIVSMGKKSSSKSSSIMGIAFILLSLTCDGITGGVQNKLKKKAKDMGVSIKPYDMMFWTNLYMGLAAAVFSLALGELNSGLSYCFANPLIFNKILKFAVCSAIGQSFIFYTIANFDPLFCTTITTTRKVFSVLLSIFLNGHALSPEGWFGLALASVGILAELLDKTGGGGHGKAHGKEK
eukprot:scaffold9105_cov169-Ochromonas_danica.AAC.4